MPRRAVLHQVLYAYWCRYAIRAQKTFSNKIYMRYLRLFLTVISDFKLTIFLLTHYCLEVKMHDVNINKNPFPF